MSNTEIDSLNIPNPLLFKFRQQVQAASKAPRTMESSLFQNNFVSFLNKSENFDKEFLLIANDYIKKLRAQAINFDYDFPSKLINGDISVRINSVDKRLVLNKRGRTNLLKLLAEKKLLFDYKQSALFNSANMKFTQDFLNSLNEDKLVEQLKTLKSSSNLDKLASILLAKFSNDAGKVKEVLETAYGVHVEGLNEHLDLTEQGIEVTPYEVRSNLQSLLIEVLRRDKGTQFSEVADAYINAKSSVERGRFADLLLTNYPKGDVTEFFQDQAMHEIDSSPNSIQLELKLDAIRRYSAMNTSNKLKTLSDILQSTKNLEVIRQLLNEMTRSKGFKHENLIEEIVKQMKSDSKPMILFALLNMNHSDLQSLLNPLSKNVEEFMETLMSTIPNLKSKIEDISNDFTNIELISNNRAVNSQESINLFDSLIDWFKSKFSIPNLVECLFNPKSNQVAKDNSLSLLGLMPDRDMIEFHAPRAYASRETQASNLLKSAIGLA
jgi:hypothetical protein